ncbi:hypothetical protein IRP63_03655 [Clostridium botulinum]|uniref:Uncharacterized protein n=1 Tax=Clostridium botulinum C/D str. DC5 TaxID=1443128 RepID=A0A0A0IFI8_CLOBO|nr:hypothetical protein [Clostridium botulinum]KEI00228.1 hypothetical protein Z952_01730 [Clostridium botulinum C/D str. BKT75002]KEI07007.1 hypothetical protein Z954_04755 [Clostridium botulinum C/D str. BKT2873]KGM99061.1 hypothetical protein Z955_09590 [Clostridium botulinum C/D str. DC5]KOC47343.1 hypothetical protein ADU88_10130 [Clostridium botulinum]KOC55164.1 hypothetical protein ADU89_05720 [Clostridium botulinum]
MHKNNSSYNIFFELLTSFKIFIKKFYLLIINSYKILTFLFKKKSIIKKLYEPIIEENIKINTNLNITFNKLRKENSSIYKQINLTGLENSKLQNNINLLTTLIIDNKTKV